MQILQVVVGVETRVTWLPLNFEFLFLLTNFTRFSKCSNSQGINIIVSIGEKEILALLKCESIFDFINDFLFIPIPSPTA